jgi:hypothetical protein
MLIGSEIDCLLVSENGLIQMSNISTALETAQKRITKITQASRRSSMTIRNEINGSSMRRYCLINIGDILRVVEAA